MRLLMLRYLSCRTSSAVISKVQNFLSQLYQLFHEVLHAKFVGSRLILQEPFDEPVLLLSVQIIYSALTVAWLYRALIYTKLSQQVVLGI